MKLLLKSKHKNKKVSAKIKKLMDEGKPQKQAVAIALDMERRGDLEKAKSFVAKKPRRKSEHLGHANIGGASVHAFHGGVHGGEPQIDYHITHKNGQKQKLTMYGRAPGFKEGHDHHKGIMDMVGSMKKKKVKKSLDEAIDLLKSRTKGAKDKVKRKARKKKASHGGYHEFKHNLNHRYGLHPEDVGVDSEADYNKKHKGEHPKEALGYYEDKHGLEHHDEAWTGKKPEWQTKIKKSLDEVIDLCKAKKLTVPPADFKPKLGKKRPKSKINLRSKAKGEHPNQRKLNSVLESFKKPKVK